MGANGIGSNISRFPLPSGEYEDRVKEYTHHL